jgi:NapC/NirT cytochrome c family, N-terminal region/Doubled CXXCH motif (Paired_CXXCH_1)
MPQQNRVRSTRRLPVSLIILIVIGVGVLFTAGGFTFAATQEQRDSFCASCHTQPESTFYQRSQTQPVDLASFHTTKQVRCIDCHSGAGITGRISAELMGASNAAKWYTGTAVQPAVLIYPITDQNCLKCHQNVTQRGFTPTEQITVPGAGGGEGGGENGRNNHWHEFLSRWQTTTPATAGSCVSCHTGHNTNGTAQTGFLNDAATRQTCDACHQVLRQRGG